MELEKMKLLEKYKKSLLIYLTRYLYHHAGIVSKDAGRFLRKSFGRWYFEGIRSGKIVKFIPQEDIVDKQDLMYIFKKVNREYVTYKPFHFKFDLNYKHMEEKSLKVQKINTEDKKIIFQIDKYKYTISLIQYGRLRDLYLGPPGYLDESIMILLIYYGFIGSKNNHLSIPPSLISGKTIELFGSPLNTCALHYCSPLDIDRRFGSLGSFFNFKFKEGTYLANPPFVEGIMTEMANILYKALNSILNLTIYVVIPVWNEGAILRGVTFKAWELLQTSPFLNDYKVLEQFEFPFYDYYDDKYIPVTNTYLMVFSNKKEEFTLDDMVEKWRTFKDNIIDLKSLKS